MDLVRLHVVHHIAYLEFNQPESLNAMTMPMAQEMSHAVTQINDNKDVRVAVLRGSGRAFSSGGSFDFLQARATQSDADNHQIMLEFYQRYLSIKQLHVPSIAAIHGYAVGAAFCLALACDMRVATTNAQMGVNFAKIGLSSGMAGLYSLFHTIGPTHAADLFFTGRLVNSEEAYRMGILNRIFEPTCWDDEIKSLATSIAANSTHAIKLMKAGLRQVPHMSIQQVFELEAQGQVSCFKHQELKEGLQAIRDKRTPRY